MELDTPTLAQELAQLEGELASLNERRGDLYRRSLEAAQDDKACVDLVANAMLTGPLGAQNKIEWPIKVNGIAWNEEAPTVFQRGELAGAWVKLALLTDPEHPVLGLHLGDVASGVKAQLGPEDKMLHLTYIAHHAQIYVPALERVVAGSDAKWGPLEDPEDLTTLFGPESSHIWHDRAYRQLAERAEQAKVDAEAEEQENRLREARLEREAKAGKEDA